MRNCPDEIQFSLFAEGHLPDAEAKAIRQHIAACQECSHVLIDILAINELHAAGLPDTLSDDIYHRSNDALQQMFLTLKPPTVTLADHLKSMLGIAAAASVAGFSSTARALTPLPAFGEGDKHFSGDSVRNPVFGASLLHEGDKVSNHHIKHEGEVMNEYTDRRSIQDAPKVVGFPGTDGRSEVVQQHYQDTCAVRSQELILRDFGLNISEDSLRNEAMAKGWYTPGQGTSLENVGNLLESHGVEINRYQNADVFTLTSELAKGHKVIIGVDSGELWDKGIFEGLQDKLGFEKADHALIVSGIDTSDPQHVKVVITDPGTGDIAKEYPLEQFVDAWKDSNCYMVSTAEPAPLAYNPEMINFDYANQHLSSIGNIPYEYFDQQVMPAAGMLDAGNPELDLLHDDFANMVNGQVSHLASSLFTVHDDTATLPDFTSDHSHLPTEGGDITFGKGQASYYADWAKHHENLAKFDVEHGNLDSAQNHLRYADDYHRHAQDELKNDQESL